MPDYPPEIEVTARRLHEMLADRRYAEMESMSGGRRLTADQIAESVCAYGCSVARPPEDLQLDVVKVDVSQDTWSVNIPIFTEKGRSDLTLEATMTETGGSLCKVEIDDLHVLWMAGIGRTETIAQGVSWLLLSLKPLKKIEL